MADTIEDTEPSSFRAVIDQFIDGRLQAKLAQLDEGDPKRHELTERYERDHWLEAAASRAKSICIATHLVKPINPRARGTNILWDVRLNKVTSEVGTHSISREITPDVTGDAAAFDVYSLLCLKVKNETLLQALMNGDAGALTALHSNPDIATALSARFISIARPPDKEASSHPLAKQLYWLTTDDTCSDGDYHLLAPLHSSPLARTLYERIQEDKFGEAAKEIRDAYHRGKWFDGVHRVYPSLAIQKLGGTKPQTVSRHNLDRRGKNYLLSSLPPTWKSSDFRLPAHATSVFDRLFSGRIEVRRTLRKFSAFLATNPTETMETRNRVDAFVARLIDEVTIMAGGFHTTLPGGWSLDEDYNDLVITEKLWLDPLRAERPDQVDFAREWLLMDWPAAIGKRFGQWLNARLEGRFAVGDSELQQWKKLLLVDESKDGWAQQLHRLRQSLDAPTYIPARKPPDDPASHEVQA